MLYGDYNVTIQDEEEFHGFAGPMEFKQTVLFDNNMHIWIQLVVQEGTARNTFQSFTYGSLILLVDLDSLVGFSGEQSTATLVKTTMEDARLTVQRTWLDHRLDLLKVVARLPVPKVHTAIVTYMYMYDSNDKTNT